MEIHSNHMVAASRLQHVGNQLCADWGPALVLLVLSRVWEVGNDGRDASGTGSLAGVDHDQKLHEAVIDVAREC